MSIDNNIASAINSKNAITEFNKIADELINESRIVVNEKEYYRICMVEFYLHGDKHPDKTCHHHEIQKEFGKWYVHRAGGGEKKGNEYSTYTQTFGVDLCLGDNANYFGVLIKGIKKNGSGELLTQIKTLNTFLDDSAIKLREAKGDAKNIAIEKYKRKSARIEDVNAFEKNSLLYIEPHSWGNDSLKKDKRKNVPDERQYQFSI
jgi:hypothetical protein